MWVAFAGASAATFTVDPGGTGDFVTIEAAIAGAASGDEILVEPGDYPQRLVVRGLDLTIRSTQGAAMTTIRDGWENSLVLVDGGDVVLEGFTITSTPLKHCVRVRVGSVAIRDSIIHDCDAYDGLGGGLRTDVGTRAVVERTEFRDNRAHFTLGARAPHIYSRGDSLEVRDCTFTGGDSDGDSGGVMVLDGDNTFTGNVFSGNSATDDGGALYAEGRPTAFSDGTYSDGVGSLLLSDNVFQGNVAGDDGGALFFIGMTDYVVERNVFCANTAALRGGGVYADAAPASGVFTHNVLQQNVATDDGGGAFFMDGSPALAFNDFLANVAGDEGAAIALKGAAVTFRHNLVAHHGTVAWSALTGTTVVAMDYDAWFANAADLDGGSPGANDVFADPLLTNVTLDGDCEDDDWTPLPTSPLVDAGDPATPDADGSPPDIGAFSLPVEGGTTTTTPPEPPEDTGTTTPPATDPTTPTTPGEDPSHSPSGTEADTGCSCASGPSPGRWWPLSLAVAALSFQRRRQRRRAVVPPDTALHRSIG